MKPSQLVDKFQKARRDKNLAVIEGVQALKHAARFNAKIHQYITCDITMLKDLLDDLANDVKQLILENITEVDEVTFAKLSPQPPRTKVIALADRLTWSFNDIGANKPIVFLEDPRDLENIGAVIRVAAAADAGAVVISGSVDIWQPAVIRGAAGLQWAIPVFSIPTFTSFLRHQKPRPLIAMDPIGESIKKVTLPQNAILIFGTERHGISKQLLGTADQILQLPMKSGVSSLNLATSVSATLYCL
jgi:TrmH family RNA methyltransferase